MCDELKEQGSDDYVSVLKTLTDIGLSLQTNGSYILQVEPYLLNEVLESLKHFGYKVAVLWAEGSWPEDNDIDDAILDSVKEWDKEEWGAAGHILDREYGNPRFHHQCAIINLRKLNRIIRCPLFDYSASTEHMHDDYTPMWINALPDAGICKSPRAKVDNLNTFDKILRTSLDANLKVFNLDYNIRSKKVCSYPESDIEWAENNVFTNLEPLTAHELWKLEMSIKKDYPDKLAMFDFKMQHATSLYLTNTESVPHVNVNDLQVVVCPCSGLHQFKYIQPSLDVMETVIWADFSTYAVKWMEILIYEWNGKDFHTFFDNNKDRLNYDGNVVYGHGTWEKFMDSFESEDGWLAVWRRIVNLEHQFLVVNLVDDYQKIVDLIEPNKNVLLQCSNIFLYEINYFNKGLRTTFNALDYIRQVQTISNKVIFNGDINGSYYNQINTNWLKWI